MAFLLIHSQSGEIVEEYSYFTGKGGKPKEYFTGHWQVKKVVLRFRGTNDEMTEVINILSKSDDEIIGLFKSVINSVSKNLQFNPLKNGLEKLRKLGVFIIPSNRGLVPDFLSVPQFLYKGESKFGKIKIKITGVDAQDFRAANEVAKLSSKELARGLSKPPLGYTWHHMDDFNPVTGECTMQLVKTRIHTLTSPHKGSVGLFEDLFNVIYKYRKNKK